MHITVKEMQPQHWNAVRRIYEEGIAGGHATFETTAPDYEKWDASHLPECRLVAVAEGHVVGWAALSPVSRRAVYRGVAEVSVYVAGDWHGLGIGKRLLQSLIHASEDAGIWTLQAGLFPENEASLGLHLACGFRLVGRREKIGQHHGRWRDTLLLERRSRRVGRHMDDDETQQEERDG